MQTSQTSLQIARVESLEIWTLDGPSRGNALDRSAVRALAQAAREVDDDSVRAVIITGASPVFSTGIDPAELAAMDYDDALEFQRSLRACVEAIDMVGPPVVAAIQGSALGAGLELALACDFRVVHVDAQIGFDEMEIATFPGAGGTQRLTRLVGVARAKEMILFARRISAAQALSLGLAHTVDHGAVLDAARRFCAPFLSGPTVALRAALDAIDSATHPLDAGLALEARFHEDTIGTADFDEGLHARVERRTPVFRGE